MSRCIPWLVLALVSSLPAQQKLTLPQAVEEVTGKYPAVQASLEQLSAAAAGVNLARTSYLPRVDVLGQVNRATRNNIFGLLLPQPVPVIPSISGPVLGTNSVTNVWGSAVGVLVQWEPFDFGLRRANVATAESTRKRSEAAVEVARFEVAAAAADTFLTTLAAGQTATAARAGVERARVLSQVVGALADAGLRPGADAARARAELALAQTQLAQAQQAVSVSRAALAQLLGVPPAEVALEAGPMLQLPPEAPAAPEQAANHPLAMEQNTAIQEVKAREKALDRSYFPRFDLQAGSYARGSGANVNGTTGGGAAGLGPNFQNWALGMTVTFPVFDLPSLRIRKQIEAHHERAETARYNQLTQDLNGEFEKAKARLDGARAVAQNTPIQVDAARAAEQQAIARYKSGLGNITEVAEAQRLLTQAEIDDSLAKLNVWRALLGIAAAQGDLSAFLREAGR